jgi:alpha-galactosidase
MQKFFPFGSFAAICATLILTAQFSLARAAETHLITISTAHSSLRLEVGKDGRLNEIGYGSNLRKGFRSDISERDSEFYPQFGDGYTFEPALKVTHADGNTSTDLIYSNDTTEAIDTNSSLTRITLKDPAYPDLVVSVCFKTYAREDVIESWSVIANSANEPVTLSRFASSSPLFQGKEYWLTQLYGDWANEANMSEEKLTPGLKILDSKIGVRAAQFRTPSFLLALNSPADEETGEVFGGSLEWSGSFQFTFDMDSHNHLRALCGINPFAEEYHLKPQGKFTTPAMLWTWSGNGKGQVSRNFHNWARRYGIRDGAKPRPVLLNNWEATGFNFNENKLVSLFDGAKELNVELFLLDDGWFGNDHPRNDDHAGLGDWQFNTNKLPQGLSYLASEANQRGLQFGIWIEPEMVNPHSDLFEKHPNWAIRQPHRELELSRHQLNLDLSNPQVHDFVWGVVDSTLSIPGISYVKWDANRFVTQPGSTYLSAADQSELLIDYNFALYDIMRRMAEKFPNTIAMACSGGGGRADYGALKYFHLFWPSDNTDPTHRVFIQWGYSHFFPAEALACHVTRSGNRPMKFTFDVAMSGALGLDLDVGKLSDDQRKSLAAMVTLYKTEIRNIVEQGDLFRLVSPYGHPRSALDFVLPNQDKAVLFVYQLENAASETVKPRGLNPVGFYNVREVNLTEGVKSQLAEDGQTISGADLMSKGLIPPCHNALESSVIEFTLAKEK